MSEQTPEHTPNTPQEVDPKQADNPDQDRETVDNSGEQRERGGPVSGSGSSSTSSGNSNPST